MQHKAITYFKRVADSIPKGMPNKKETIQRFAYASATSISVTSCLRYLQSKSLFSFKGRPNTTMIAITAINLFAHTFLLYSIESPHVKLTKESVNPYGVSPLQTSVVRFLSFLYCLYPAQLFSFNLQDFTPNVLFTAIVLVESITAVYAGFDILNLNNLRWFLRTWPYSLIGIFFIQVAIYQMKSANYNVLLGSNSLTNTILPFITITYVVQVFNERFCKKQDD
ncbi:hypothetical protein [uncultured Bifidobacterium sp.]|uniref:hypothetical protein n=1 Tax=uncultured Bifidobacterium sp. TaxID=165187 RepID=UPI002592601F|nr:hypothetical protein [uncultured Bifidobacterium sp.]